MRRAYCTPRWPSPPTPNTATKSPALAGEFRSALKVVRPAHSSGAASTDERSSGTAIRPLDFGDHHLRVAAIVLYAGVALVCAVHEIAVAAVLAVPAVAAEEADADALAHLPAFDAVADHIDPSDRFVARHPRPLDRQDPLDRRGIRMAHAAGLDADADMARRWIKQRLFGQLQLARAHRMHGPIGRRRFASSAFLFCR